MLHMQHSSAISKYSFFFFFLTYARFFIAYMLRVYVFPVFFPDKVEFFRSPVCIIDCECSLSYQSCSARPENIGAGATLRVASREERGSKPLPQVPLGSFARSSLAELALIFSLRHYSRDKLAWSID